MATQAEERQVRVLLVDDDPDDYAITRDLLADLPERLYALEWVAEYDSGLKAAHSGDYDVVLLDYSLGAKTGLDLLTEARRLGCDAPVIILTGQSDVEIDLAAMQAGAVDYLEKARLDAVLLDRTLRYAIQQKQIEAHLERRVRERTEELDRANESLRATDRRKDQFLATLAHELRNPLAPILNALEIMRLTGDDPSAVASARPVIERQIQQLIRLIGDLLDVTRISRGKLQLTIEPLFVNDIIDAALEQSRPLLDKAEQSLKLELPAAPIHLNGDRVRLAQVLTNLLNNSAKYSDPGGTVVLSVELAGSDVVIRVRDTGLGIAAEMLDQVFEPFTQIDRNSHRTQGGLGIGLNLVRNLVHLHGGRVEARSDGLGRGATFTVILPAG